MKHIITFSDLALMSKGDYDWLCALSTIKDVSGSILNAKPPECHKPTGKWFIVDKPESVEDLEDGPSTDEIDWCIDEDVEFDPAIGYYPKNNCTSTSQSLDEQLEEIRSLTQQYLLLEQCTDAVTKLKSLFDDGAMKTFNHNLTARKEIESKLRTKLVLYISGLLNMKDAKYSVYDLLNVLSDLKAPI